MLLLLQALRVIILTKAVEASDSRRIWMSKVEPMGDESLKVQALVVKDEEVAAATAPCKAATRNDVRHSTKRYLMCAGSILTSRYVLTSASCIHEATHVRHNIRAPLAAMIAPFSTTAQVIKIAGYSIHPDHLVDPRDEHYALHNVAIVKLVCRILKRNLHEIQLPTQPFFDQCSENNCKVAITKKVGPMSFIMYEVSIDVIGIVRTKRELLAASSGKNLNETANEARINNHDIKKVLESNENSTDGTRIIKTAPRASNENSKYIEKKGADKTVVGTSNKRLVSRESQGMKGCPQTGSAVMSNRVQAAIVAVSCDDRQPETPWQYTDLYDNLSWINEMIGNWKPTKPTLAACNTCIYNYFIDYNCRNRAQCRKNLHSGSDSKILAQLTPKCSRNYTDFDMPFAHRGRFKSNDSQFLNRAYVDAINNLYLNKHNHFDENDNDNEFRPHLLTQKNSYRNVDETVKLRLFSQAAEQREQQNSAAEKTLVLDYGDNRGDLDANYRKVKTTHDNDYKQRDYADGNDYQERKYRDYQPRYNQIKKPSVAISDGKSVESLEQRFAVEESIPKEFSELYKQFLEEYKRSKENVRRNVVKRAK